MLFRVRKNYNPGPITPPESPLVNVDELREDGTYPLADANGGGVFPEGAVFPVSVVVSAGGDTQTLTDDGATAFVRNFGLEWWGDWA